MRAVLLLLPILTAFLLGGCTEIQVGAHLAKKFDQQPCVANGGIKVGNPYMVDGIRYEPMKSSLGYSEKGIASWYGEDFHGQASANGECYNMYAFTAAHKTLPLPTIVRVTNLENNRSIVLKVNDRGPFVRGRIIDLSYAAAQSLDMTRTGTAPVLVEAIGGPHHQAGGYKGGGDNTQLASLGPDNNSESNAEKLETLPSVVPQSATEEPLGAFTPQSQQASANVTKVPKQDYEPKMVTDTAPLKKTLVYVQVGAYSSLDNAAGQKSKLMDLYETAAITKMQSNGKELLRVRAGPFQSVADADEALTKIVAAGFNGAQIKVED